jgi:nucleotide-binding universal stress UspA family protein
MPPEPLYELGTDGPATIVVGVDGSDTSLRAAAYAAGVARRERTKLIAVYARRIPAGAAAMPYSSGLMVAAAYATQDEIEAQLREAFEQERREWGVEARLIVRGGDPFSVLSAVAREVRADCVVVGSSASFGHRFAGSLAIRLIRSARWPVTVVP